MKYIFATLFLINCSGPTATQSQPEPRDQIRDCPLLFEKLDWCAEIQWDEPPRPDMDAAFTLKGWNRKDANAVTPALISLLKMSCCGSIFSLETSAVGLGTYRVTKVRFLPGEWDLIIRINNEATIDEKSLHFRFD